MDRIAFADLAALAVDYRDPRVELFTPDWLIKLAALFMSTAAAWAVLLWLDGPPQGRWPLPLIIFLIGFALSILWLVRECWRAVHLGIFSKANATTRLDTVFAVDRSFSQKLAATYALNSLRSSAREIASAIKRNERDTALLAPLSAIGGSLGAVIPYIFGQNHLNQMWLNAIPAFILGAGIGAILKSDENRRLVRLEFPVSEAILIKEICESELS